VTPHPLTLADLDPERIRQEMTARGWRTGRADSLLRHLYAGTPIDEARFGAPVARWASALPLTPSTLRSRHIASDGTVKLLVSMNDGQTVECVLMPSEKPHESAACVSSQVGCAMGCDFCASTLSGLSRNLTAAEIVGQFLLLRAESHRLGKRLATLVFMGMGEPMHNLAEVIPAIRRIGGSDCGQLGFKNIQVSTVGIVPGIRALADSGVRVALALSLHGPDDDTRSRIVPAGKKYTVEATLDAAWAYQQKTGRVSNIEYCLLAGVNDSPGQARQLAHVLAGRRMHVNLIPHNPIGTGLSGAVYYKPSPEAVAAFLNVLRDCGVAAHLRRTRGDDASAACGQLRRSEGLAVLTGISTSRAGTLG
jgi:23S rRNA (adenine2503-C2)-methyltransferase